MRFLLSFAAGWTPAAPRPPRRPLHEVLDGIARDTLLAIGRVLRRQPAPLYNVRCGERRASPRLLKDAARLIEHGAPVPHVRRELHSGVDRWCDTIEAAHAAGDPSPLLPPRAP